MAGSPKWGVSVVIPLAPSVLDNLPEKKTSNYIFNIKGLHLGETWWRKNFIKAMENLKINYKERNLTPHSFRQSLNTNLLVAGCSELYVKKYLGWTDKNKDTQAIYTHITPENLSIIADRIDEIYSGKSNIIDFKKLG